MDLEKPVWRASPGQILLVGALLLAGDAALRNVHAAPGAPTVITAQEFRLVDGNGKVRALLGTSPDSGSNLTFLDNEGKQRARFGLSDKGNSDLRLYDGDQKLHAQLTIQANGVGGLALTDSEAKTRAVLQLQSNGCPAFSFLGKDGQNRALLSLLPDDSVSLVTGDPRGKGAIGIAATPDGKARISVTDQAGAVIFSAP